MNCDLEILRECPEHGYYVRCKKGHPPEFWSEVPPEKIRMVCSVVDKPTITKKVLNITKAIIRFSKISIQNKRLQIVKKDEYKLRLEICNNCTYRSNENTCKVCGCKVSGIFNKAQLITEQCPLGKWPILVVSSQVPEVYEPNNIQGHKTG